MVLKIYDNMATSFDDAIIDGKVVKPIYEVDSETQTELFDIIMSNRCNFRLIFNEDGSFKNVEILPLPEELKTENDLLKEKINWLVESNQALLELAETLS